MRRFILSKHSLVVLVALVAALGCGDGDVAPVDSGAVDPPENPERELPTAGGPEDDDFEAPEPPPEYERDDYVTGGPEEECCPVVFAFAPDNPQEVQSALLRGTLAPLRGQEGLELQESDGVWSGEACLPPEEYGTYHYELGLRSAGAGDPFLSTAYNPYAPTAPVNGQLVNAWIPGDDCAAVDVAVHAQISEL